MVGRPVGRSSACPEADGWAAGWQTVRAWAPRGSGPVRPLRGRAPEGLPLQSTRWPPEGGCAVGAAICLDPKARAGRGRARDARGRLPGWLRCFPEGRRLRPRPAVETPRCCAVTAGPKVGGSRRAPWSWLPWSCPPWSSAPEGAEPRFARLRTKPCPAVHDSRRSPSPRFVASKGPNPMKRVAFPPRRGAPRRASRPAPRGGPVGVLPGPPRGVVRSACCPLHPEGWVGGVGLLPPSRGRVAWAVPEAARAGTPKSPFALGLQRRIGLPDIVLHRLRRVDPDGTWSSCRQAGSLPGRCPVLVRMAGASAGTLGRSPQLRWRRGPKTRVPLPVALAR